jgi:hypothetical protein
MTIPFVTVMSFTTIATYDSVRIGRERAVQKLLALAKQATAARRGC